MSDQPRKVATLHAIIASNDLLAQFDCEVVAWLAIDHSDDGWERVAIGSEAEVIAECAAKGYDTEHYSARFEETEPGKWRFIPRTPPPLTVSDVISALSKFPPSLPVLLDVHDWYTYVSYVVGPPVVDGQVDWTESSDYSLPTLIQGRTFDSRDL